jgi:hypothetical protein
MVICGILAQNARYTAEAEAAYEALLRYVEERKGDPALWDNIPSDYHGFQAAVHLQFADFWKTCENPVKTKKHLELARSHYMVSHVPEGLGYVDRLFGLRSEWGRCLEMLADLHDDRAVKASLAQEAIPLREENLSTKETLDAVNALYSSIIQLLGAIDSSDERYEGLQLRWRALARRAYEIDPSQRFSRNSYAFAMCAEGDDLKQTNPNGARTAFTMSLEFFEELERSYGGYAAMLEHVRNALDELSGSPQEES